MQNITQFDCGRIVTEIETNIYGADTTTVIFERHAADKHGDFYNTMIEIVDPVDNERLTFSLDKLYRWLEEDHRLREAKNPYIWEGR